MRAPASAAIFTSDPILAITEGSEFAARCAAMARHPARSRSLLSDDARALLVSLVRATVPEHVVEIGTYAGGTAEVLAEALAENGHGTLHTVSPHDADRFGPVFAAWPKRLRACGGVGEMNSMGFFMRAVERRIKAGVILIDGNHDYEFAAFDVAAAARIVTPGGYIFVDNIRQPGPFMAVAEFVNRNPSWRFCAAPMGRMEKPFDRSRYFIKNTDFAVLRAPVGLCITTTPSTCGEIGWGADPLRGFRLEFAALSSPTLVRVQCIFRAFQQHEITEIAAEASSRIEDGARQVTLTFDQPIKIDGKFLRRAAEPWFWSEGGAIELSGAPLPL